MERQFPTAKEQVELFFAKYVEWMCRDIQREIDWELQNKDAGNLLCALGLLVYTEVLGRVRRWNQQRSSFYTLDGREQPELNFTAAFDRFDGGRYGEWRRSWEAKHLGDTSIYEVVRSGMVHEYRPKAPSWIHFGHERSVGLTEEDEGGAPVLKFFIVPYLRHFRVEAVALREELAADPDASLPPAHLRQQSAIFTGPIVTSDSAVPVSGSTSGAAVPLISNASVASGPDLHSLSDEDRRRLLEGR